MKKKLRALIVDDSEDDACLIIFGIENGGFSVDWTRVQGAADLKQSLLGKDWDILLTDFSMPQFSGLDVLAIVREFAPHLPVIVISGTISEETAVDCMRAGAGDFFSKSQLIRLPEAVRRQLSETEIIRRSQNLQKDLLISESLRWEAQAENLRREIASRKEIEILLHKAQDANRQKEEFLAVLSDELRTPMNAITGWAELLAKKECSTDEFQEIFEAIFRNARAQNRIIDDLLDISRITTGCLELESKKLHLVPLVQAAIESVAPAAKARGITVVLDTRANDDILMGDRKRLLQVVWNILSNSIKFTESGGSVHVLVSRYGDALELKVIDTGIGIAAEFLPFIFEKFRQGNGALTRKHGGLGLGLAIVQKLVDLHGGQTVAHSGGLNQGTTLTIQLPAKISHSILSTPETKLRMTSPIRDLSGLRILIVDDNDDALALLKRRLEGQKALVVSTLSSHEALKLFKQDRPDIFVSDIQMPEMSGYDLMREVRKFEQATGIHTPCAALTAHAGEEDVRSAIEAGFDVHLAKPLDSKKLLQAMFGLIDQSAKMEQLK